MKLEEIELYIEDIEDSIAGLEQLINQLKCPYCYSTKIEGIVFAKAEEIEDMGCMAIMTSI